MFCEKERRLCLWRLWKPLAASVVPRLNTVLFCGSWIFKKIRRNTQNSDTEQMQNYRPLAWLLTSKSVEIRIRLSISVSFYISKWIISQRLPWLPQSQSTLAAAHHMFNPGASLVPLLGGNIQVTHWSSTIQRLASSKFLHDLLVCFNLNKADSSLQVATACFSNRARFLFKPFKTHVWSGSLMGNKHSQPITVSQTWRAILLSTNQEQDTLAQRWCSNARKG